MAKEVYRSTDAQGNIVFSDQQTPGAKTVIIEAPNIADPVKIPSRSAGLATTPKPKPGAAPEPEVELDPVPQKRKKKRKKRR